MIYRYSMSTFLDLCDLITPAEACASNLRCSRPLCSSQNTGGTHCAWPKPVTQESEDRRHPSDVSGPEVRSASRRGRSGPSGPNSVQKTSCSAGISSVLASEKYWDARFAPGHNVNVPPMSATGEHVSPKWLGS
jgi:hypothetical protein